MATIEGIELVTLEWESSHSLVTVGSLKPKEFLKSGKVFKELKWEKQDYAFDINFPTVYQVGHKKNGLWAFDSSVSQQSRHGQNKSTTSFTADTNKSW